MNKRVNIEAERAAFEAWHRNKFATKHSTGQPTRDMHNGIYDENYGPKDQQLMWEVWQAARATPPATGETEDLPPLLEVFADQIISEAHAAGWGMKDDSPFADSVLEMIERAKHSKDLHEAIAHYLRKQAGQVGDARLADMALLMARLSYQLNKAVPGNEFSRRATVFLQKHDLIGSPLRTNDAGQEAEGESNADQA